MRFLLPVVDWFRGLVKWPPGRVAAHVGGWALFLSYAHLGYTAFEVSPLIAWGFALKDTLAAVVGFYFFSAVVLPRLILERRWLLAAGGLLLLYYAWAAISYAFYTGLDYYGLVQPDNSYVHRIIDAGPWKGLFAWYGVSIGLFDFSVTAMLPILARFCYFLLASGNRNLQLERENLHLEISFLKAQVNPHFLFNTLNNIYSMVVKQDPLAPTMVHHLSALLHYTVHESNAPLVSLPRELAFLEAYLELERLRYGQKVRITYHRADMPPGFVLTPLLFFPFVENAFKHGVDSSLDASWVAIEVAVQGTYLHFSVRNSFSPAAPRPPLGGVGIANVRQRLALHYAPADYQLLIEPAAETYRVALTLRLAAAAVPSTTSPAPAQHD